MPGEQSPKSFQGFSFKGQRLSGEDFSGCDIRGANFTNATLIGANFSHVKAGQPLLWVVTIVSFALLLTISAGYVSAYAGGVVGSLMVKENDQPLALWSSIATLNVLVVLILITIKQGLGIALGAFSLLVAFSVVLLAGLGKASTTVAAIVQAVAIAGAIAGSVLASGTLVVLKTAIRRMGLPAFVIAFVLGSLFGGWEGLEFESKHLIQGLPITTLITGGLLGFSTYIGLQVPTQDKKYWLIYKAANFVASLGGTRFRGSNLTDANFTQATLSSTDFRKALLTRTCWFQAKNLEQARVEGTYLKDVRVRQLVTTKEGSGQHFEYFDLQGLNLKDAALKDTFFIGTDLSESTLENAELIGARLAKAQLYQANLRGACLTGAYIENWGISTDTNLKAIRCSYIYMRLPSNNDPDPCRKPDNRTETFKDGDFTDFIAPIIKTLDLYQTQNVDLREVGSKFKTLDLFHHEGIDPSAVAIALQQLTEQHPEAELKVIALEGRGNEKIRLQAKVARDVNRSELYAEYFSRYSKIKSLSYGDLQALLAGMAEREEQIRSLEKLLENALKQPKFYVETYHNQGDTMSNKSESSNYDLRESKFGGGFAGTKGTQSGGTFYDYSSNPNLSQAVVEIQQLLEQLESTNPATTSAEKMTVAAKAVDVIENNPALKARVIAALKSGGTESFKQAINHPIAKNLIPIIEEWVQAE